MPRGLSSLADLAYCEQPSEAACETLQRHAATLPRQLVGVHSNICLLQEKLLTGTSEDDMLSVSTSVALAAAHCLVTGRHFQHDRVDEGYGRVIRVA